MPPLLIHSDYWRLQAQDARLTAQRLEGPEAKADMLAKADEYDRASPPAIESGTPGSERESAARDAFGLIRCCGGGAC